MSGPLTIQCPKCRAKLKLKDDRAVGKKVPCPKCKRPFVVEAPPQDDLDDFSALDEFDSFEDDSFGDDEFGDEMVERPASPRRQTSAGGRRGKSAKGKKKRKKAGGAGWVKPVAIGTAALLFLSLMVGAGFLVANLMGRVNNKIDMAWLPPDAELIISLDVDGALNAPLVQSMVQDEAFRGALDKFTQESGIDIAQIDSVVFGASGFESIKSPSGELPAVPILPDFNSMHGVAVVRSKAPIDISKLTSDPQTETLEHQGTTWYRGKGSQPGVPSFGIFLPDGSTMVTGREDDVKAAIERGGQQVRRADLDFINAQHQLLIVTIPKDPMAVPPQTKNVLKSMSPQATSMSDKLDGKVVGSCIGLTFSDGVELEIQGDCLGADDAETARQEISNLLNEGRQKFAQSAASVPPNYAGIVNVAKSILDRIAVSADGSTFAVTASVTGSDINTIKEAAGPMMPLLAGRMAGGLAGAQPPGGMPNMTPPAGLRGSVGSGLPTMGTSPGGAGLGNPITQAREAALRAQCKNNLKQIGLAMHNFHEVNGHLPPAASAGLDGKPLLSWRVQILPYLEQNALYQQFKLDEPWDSEHNKTLIARMPAVFACPGGTVKPGTTTYLGVSSERAIFNGTQPVGFREITDGTSNTIMVVEANAAQAVFWTKPDDFAYSASDPAQGLAVHHQQGFHALCCDGRVFNIPANYGKTLLAGLFTRNGGERNARPPAQNTAAPTMQPPKITIPSTEAERLAQSASNLKKIGETLLITYETHAEYPKSSGWDKRRNTLSWRVHLLPFLGEFDLFKRFKRDEPWDSAHNKKLIPLMPAVFACPSGKVKAGMTTYLGVVGPNSVFNPTSRVRKPQVSDGLSFTAMIVDVDASRAVVWTKPEDFSYSSDNPLEGLIGKYTAGFHALFCDASTRLLPAKTGAETVNAIFTISGGEKVSLP